MRTPKLLTLSAGIAAVDALRELHRVCFGMDAAHDAARPTEAEYQRALRAAEDALRACPEKTR